MTRADVEELHPGAVLADGFDEAIIDVIRGRVRYDLEKCVSILMERDGWTRSEALDWMDYNVIGCYSGPRSPTWR